MYKCTRWALIATCTLTLAAGCTSDPIATPPDPSPAGTAQGTDVHLPTLADLLSAAPDRCPLTGLVDAVDAAGLATTAAPTGLVATTAGVGHDMGGGAVECDVELTGGGSISLTMVVGKTGQATNALGPRLQDDLKIAGDDYVRVVEAAAALSPGQFADLPGEAAVVLTPITVDGASTAALELSAKGPVTRAQLQVVASDLIG